MILILHMCWSLSNCTQHWVNQMSSEETRHVNGPTDGRPHPEGEETLPPIRTQGYISKVCVCWVVGGGGGGYARALGIVCLVTTGQW